MKPKFIFMLDNETLSAKRLNPFILSIGLCGIELPLGMTTAQYMDNNPLAEVHRSIQKNSYLIDVDSEDQNLLSRHVDLDTIKWWMSQDKEAKDSTFNSKNRVSVYLALKAVFDIINAKQREGFDVYLMANGVLEDVAWIKTLHEDAISSGIATLDLHNWPIHYRNHLCYRTILRYFDSSAAKERISTTLGKFVYHNAQADAEYQLLTYLVMSQQYGLEIK